MACKKDAQTPIRVKGSDKCPHHQGRKVVFVCRDCNGSLACVSCVTSVHSQHKMEEIADALPAIKVKIQDYIDDLEKRHLPNRKEKIKSLKNKQTKVEENCEDVVTKVKQRTKELKKELDRLEAEYIQTCRDVATRKRLIINNDIARIQSNITDMELKIEEMKNLLQTGSDIQLCDAVGNTCTNEYYHYFEENGRLQEFLPELESALAARKIMAGLYTCMYTKYGFNVKMCHPWVQTTPATFSPEFSYIDRIFLTPNNKCWAHYNGCLQLVNKEGKTEDTVVLNDNNITYFSVSPTTNQIWWCKKEERRVGRIVNGSLVTAFKTQQDPLCISVSKKDDDVIAGMKGQLIRYTHTGKVMCQSELQESSDLVVRKPVGISQCPLTENVAVADGLAVSIFSKTLQPLFRADRGQNRICEYMYDNHVKGVWYSEDGTIFVLHGKTIFHTTANGTYIQTISIFDHMSLMIICSVCPNGDVWLVFNYGRGYFFKKSSST